MKKLKGLLKSVQKPIAKPVPLLRLILWLIEEFHKLDGIEIAQEDVVGFHLVNKDVVGSHGKQRAGFIQQCVGADKEFHSNPSAYLGTHETIHVLETFGGYRHGLVPRNDRGEIL